MSDVTIGRQVHFYQGGKCYTATVVKVWTNECVNLFVPPTGSDEPVAGALNQTRNAMSITYDCDVHPKDWSWHWPR